jgi:hypothetical protein
MKTCPRVVVALLLVASVASAQAPTSPLRAAELAAQCAASDFEPRGRVIVDPAQHVGEPSFGGDVVERRGSCRAPNYVEALLARRAEGLSIVSP